MTASAHPELLLDRLLSENVPLMQRAFSPLQQAYLLNRCLSELPTATDGVVDGFVRLYHEEVQRARQESHPFDSDLDAFLTSRPEQLKVVWGDCIDVLRAMRSESVHLFVTSPPYYNAREYSHWDDLDRYLDDMRAVVSECHRVLANHRAFVFNIADVFDNDRRRTRATWGRRRIPLAAYFVSLFEDAGFRFVDDFIWDKGEVQSQRHKNGDNPYPLYQYPINCYEHIMVFFKHEPDETPYPCPACGSLDVSINGHGIGGFKTWECNDARCSQRSSGGRGKRFSARLHVMTGLRSEANLIDDDLLQAWRRDIVRFPPVIKIDSNGRNRLGHTAPFPAEIPAYAVRALSGVGETVVDPFAGSFTTPIEAVRHGRVGVGVELNKVGFRDAVIANLDRSLGLFGNGWEETDVGGVI